MLGPKPAPRDFRLGPKLGEGNFGRTYEGLRRGAGPLGGGGDGDYDPKYGAQTPSEKKRRVVLKRLGSGRANGMGNDAPRNDFLSRGTVARGAVEVGRAEAYVNDVLRRSLCPGVAKFRGRFEVTASNTAEDNYDFPVGTEWLCWDFETDATLGDLISLGDYPETAAEYLAKGAKTEEAMRRRITKNVARQLLGICAGLHARGIVHRDIKPENLLVTNRGQCKLIDMGAAVDMRMGVNYSNSGGMLDPLYGPPELFVLPEDAPRAGNPLFAALGSPIIWLAYAPDLFDAWSVGITLLRVAVPVLSTETALRKFNQELARYDYDLRAWRRETSNFGGGSLCARCDFSALDADFGAGWDLCCRLVTARNKFQRGRLGCRAARFHPFLWLP